MTYRRLPLWHRWSRGPALNLLRSAGLAVLFVVVTVGVLLRPDNAVDRVALDVASGYADSWLAAVATAVRALGVALPIVAVLPVAIGLWARWTPRTALLFAGGYVAAFGASFVLKAAIERPRPVSELSVAVAADEASFPSTSVTSAVVFWGLVLVLLPLAGSVWWRRPLRAVALLVIVLIGPSRLVVGEHWFTDVVGGYLFGAAVVTLLAGLELRRSGRPVPRVADLG